MSQAIIFPRDRCINVNNIRCDAVPAACSEHGEQPGLCIGSLVTDFASDAVLVQSWCRLVLERVLSGATVHNRPIDVYMPPVSADSMPTCFYVSLVFHARLQNYRDLCSLRLFVWLLPTFKITSVTNHIEVIRQIELSILLRGRSTTRVFKRNQNKFNRKFDVEIDAINVLNPQIHHGPTHPGFQHLFYFTIFVTNLSPAVAGKANGSAL